MIQCAEGRRGPKFTHHRGKGPIIDDLEGGKCRRPFMRYVCDLGGVPQLQIEIHAVVELVGVDHSEDAGDEGICLLHVLKESQARLCIAAAQGCRGHGLILVG